MSLLSTEQSQPHSLITFFLPAQNAQGYQHVIGAPTARIAPTYQMDPGRVEMSVRYGS